MPTDNVQQIRLKDLPKYDQRVMDLMRAHPELETTSGYAEVVRIRHKIRDLQDDNIHPGMINLTNLLGAIDTLETLAVQAE